MHMLLEPDGRPHVRDVGRRDGGKGEAVMRRKSGGGTEREVEGGREVSHEFTAWLNIVNYWLAD